ncbi:polyubiquitin-like [Protopterus annectens]|uniref:polyubiquitin-like n=1 Tax=Protopterus annectens TaxID=7888 RepID=UPI001CFACC8F|nr:polyubiquitin-like [Protopterus annectens]
MAANKQLWVMVKDPAGRAVTSFTVSTDSTVGDLKAALQAAGCTSVTAHDMGLLYKRDQLPDTSTLRDAVPLHIVSAAGGPDVNVTQRYRRSPSAGLEFLIYVRTRCTPTLRLYVTGSESLGSLKARLAEILGVPADQLELSGASGVLEGDARSLESLGIEPESTLSCLLRAGAEAFAIFVRGPHGNTFDVYVQKEELAGSLKRKIADLIEVPVDNLRIICGSRLLEDDGRTVSDYSIKAGSVVHVVQRRKLNNV